MRAIVCFFKMNQRIWDPTLAIRGNYVVTGQGLTHGAYNAVLWRFDIHHPEKDTHSL
jgi:hypothetical protein